MMHTTTWREQLFFFLKVKSRKFYKQKWVESRDDIASKYRSSHKTIMKDSFTNQMKWMNFCYFEASLINFNCVGWFSRLFIGVIITSIHLSIEIQLMRYRHDLYTLKKIIDRRKLCISCPRVLFIVTHEHFAFSSIRDTTTMSQQLMPPTLHIKQQ